MSLSGRHPSGSVRSPVASRRGRDGGGLPGARHEARPRGGLKVLPDAFVSDPERLARLEREARLLASLNHPNIATLHAFENLDGVRFLVMEVIEGQTLGERLSDGPLPVRDALDFFRQVADGLAAAHRKGVVHRDLKPGNLKIAPGGHAKILDFGLATTIVPAGAGDVTSSPTASVHHTATGVIQGTAPYMAPEQAKGKQADERSDVFSFGVTLYEALAGRRAFAGDTVTEVLAAVLEREPDWSALPPDTPDLVRFLLRRCLKKNPDDRLRDMAEAKAVLGEAMNAGTSSSAAMAGVPRRRREEGPAAGSRWGWAPWHSSPSASLSGRLLWKKAGVTSSGTGPPFPDRPQGEAIDRRGQFPRSLPMESTSRTWTTTGCGSATWIGSTAARFRGARKPAVPFWSPDGRSVAFVAGGSPQESADRRRPGEDHLRAEAGRLPVSRLRHGVPRDRSSSLSGPALGLFEVSSEGGELRPLLKPDPAKGFFDFHWPSFLPDGRIAPSRRPSRDGITSFIWRSSTGGRSGGSCRSRRLRVEFPVYSKSGHILFNRLEGIASLYAVPFDASKLTVTGEPVRLVGGRQLSPASPPTASSSM